MSAGAEGRAWGPGFAEVPRRWRHRYNREAELGWGTATLGCGRGAAADMTTTLTCTARLGRSAKGRGPLSLMRGGTNQVQPREKLKVAVADGVEAVEAEEVDVEHRPRGAAGEKGACGGTGGRGRVRGQGLRWAGIGRVVRSC